MCAVEILRLLRASPEDNCVRATGEKSLDIRLADSERGMLRPRISVPGSLLQVDGFAGCGGLTRGVEDFRYDDVRAERA